MTRTHSTGTQQYDRSSAPLFACLPPSKWKQTLDDHLFFICQQAKWEEGWTAIQLHVCSIHSTQLKVRLRKEFINSTWSVLEVWRWNVHQAYTCPRRALWETPPCSLFDQLHWSFSHQTVWDKRHPDYRLTHRHHIYIPSCFTLQLLHSIC